MVTPSALGISNVTSRDGGGTWRSSLYINPEMPKFESFVNRIPLSMLSYAFLKSIKAAKVAFLCRQLTDKTTYGHGF